MTLSSTTITRVDAVDLFGFARVSRATQIVVMMQLRTSGVTRFAARDFQKAFDLMETGKSGKVILDWNEI